MSRGASKTVEITAASLQLDVPSVGKGVIASAFEPADGTEAALPIEAERFVAPEATTWADRAKAVQAAAGKKPDAEAAAPEHKDIGQWEAILWKARPMWRHRRTGQTLSKRADVQRNRNLK